METCTSIQQLMQPLLPGLMGVELTVTGGRLCAVVTQTQLVLGP